ncbi:hypothetical protein Mchl_4725 [Methylorubrum extorquens CM4]|uniref:Uncharacterized protein n=1 Tax=Methylorubrum extorquens (strain CM4 / NCIMB 13688) TaxID=440085 RepID=B7KQV8_METC4|nr:hypothetical protein Mchl_4725 [Methylorubrum extorquens CM4]
MGMVVGAAGSKETLNRLLAGTPAPTGEGAVGGWGDVLAVQLVCRRPE